jgi:hypothetical protein
MTVNLVLQLSGRASWYFGGAAEPLGTFKEGKGGTGRGEADMSQM